MTKKGRKTMARKSPEGTCKVPRCRQHSSIIYGALPRGMQKEVCDNHWQRHCNDEDRFDLRKVNW